MFGRKRQPMSLEPQFHPGVFDSELYLEVVGCIEEKTALRAPRSEDLASKITISIGYLCASFDEGFIEEINARVGDNNYSVHVYLSRHNQITL